MHGGWFCTIISQPADVCMRRNVTKCQWCHEPTHTNTHTYSELQQVGCGCQSNLNLMAGYSGSVMSEKHPPLLVSASSKNNSFHSSQSSDLNYLTTPCSFSILAARSSSRLSWEFGEWSSSGTLFLCCYGNSRSLPGGYSHKLAVNTQRWHMGIFSSLLYTPVTALMYKVKAHRHFL